MDFYDKEYWDTFALAMREGGEARKLAKETVMNDLISLQSQLAGWRALALMYASRLQDAKDAIAELTSE